MRVDMCKTASDLYHDIPHVVNFYGCGAGGFVIAHKLVQIAVT